MKRYLRIGEVAERLGLDESTICKYSENGRINCLRDLNNYRRFDVREVHRFEQEFLRHEEA